MRRYLPFVAAVAVRVLVAGVPALSALSMTGRDRKQSNQIRKLKLAVRTLRHRVSTIEDAPDTTTGLADDISKLKNKVGNLEDTDQHFYNVTQSLGYNGHYYGNVQRTQVVLDAQDGCTNGQPRNAMWSNSTLNC